MRIASARVPTTFALTTYTPLPRTPPMAAGASAALATFEIENGILPTDTIYKYDNAANQRHIAAKPWVNDVRYFAAMQLWRTRHRHAPQRCGRGSQRLTSSAREVSGRRRRSHAPSAAGGT